MRKYTRKLLAFFVSFVMAVVMVPMNGFNSYAADTTVSVTTYQKVTSTNNWESDKEYVIYSNGYALVNKNGSISAQQVTLTGENPTVPDSAIWKISKSGDYYNISNNNQYLNINDKLSLGDSQNLKIRSSADRIYNSDKTYLKFNDSWTVSSSKSSVEIYKKVTETKTIKDLTPDEKLYNDDAAVGKEYPDPGFVKIKKQATSTNFNGTGVAEVELSATGVPMRKGSDIVLILDVSSSMKDGFTPGTPMYDTKKAAEDFVNKVLGDNADGTKSNNRLALVTFAGRAPGSNTYTGEEGYGNEILNTFKNANSKGEIIKKIKGIQHQQGTDYDYAFKAAGQLLEKADSNRDKYVVFMTDGEPYNYNGIQNFNSIPFINGVPQEHKLSSDIKTKYGDKLKLYSIGFDMQLDKAKAILQNISSGDGYYIDATNTTELNDAFSKIATSIKKAGTDAVVTDVIGDAFTLQTTKTLPNSKPNLTFNPTIKVTSYDTYTHADYNAGNCEYNDIGKRKDNKEVLETVRFSADGKAAYSDQIGNGNTNILEDGVITAKTFKYTVATKTFEWTIGDITEQDIALSYYVYLKGSMEGERGDGLYDTNENATINYKNYLGQDTTREFEKPKMPWGAAVVNYEFYLVNEKGQPVNSKGDIIPFENRVKISDVKSVKFNWNNSTKVEAKVEASKLVPKGYSLHIENATYIANAVSSGKGSYKIGGTIPTEPSDAQQSTIMYQADEQYANSYVAFGVLNKTTLIPDTVVLDYGKSIDIDVMANDRVQDAVLDSVASNDTKVDVKLGDGSTDTLVNDFDKQVKLTNGKATVEDGKVVYTPTKYMDSIDKFLYSAKVTTSSTVEGGKDINYYRYQQVTVIPATTVYYEDNFGSEKKVDENGIIYSGGISYSGNWGTEGSSSNSKQDSYVEGKDLYGKDSSYERDNQLSAGSAHVVTGKSDKSVKAEFKFKGTGFDIISRTNSTSTKIVIQVKDSSGNIVKSKVLDNLYQSGDLYQIPVYKVHDLTYGEYTVVITVGASSKVGENANFYLDAIRIYDPLGKDNNNNKDFDEANIQYKADKEAYASITELRKILIKADSFTAGQPVSQTLKGAVFVDKTEDEYSITNYENNGPNNEVYLKKGQSIAFKLTTTGDPTSIKIGAKAPNGEAKFEFGSSANINDPISLNTATDMYYDVTNNIKFTTNDDGSKEGIVVITNKSEEDNIVSLTDLKITYNEPQVKTSYSVDNNTVEQALKVAKLRTEKTEDTSNNNISSNDENDDNQPSSDNTNPSPSHNIFQTIKNWFSKWF